MKNMISKKIKFKIFILIMFVVFIIGAVSVLAAEVSYSQNYPWQRAEGISGIVQKFYTMALATVGVAALGALIYGAILWTVSEAVSSKQDAMEWIKGALLGLVLLLGAVLLLRTINPELVKLKEPGLPKPAAMPPVSSTTYSGGNCSLYSIAVVSATVVYKCSTNGRIFSITSGTFESADLEARRKCVEGCTGGSCSEASKSLKNSYTVRCSVTGATFSNEQEGTAYLSCRGKCPD